MAASIASRKVEILQSRRTLELQTLDLLCTQTALLPTAAGRLAEAGILPQLRQRLGISLDARAALAAEAAKAAEAGAESEHTLTEKEAEVAEARAEARRGCLQLLGLLNSVLRSPEARAAIRHRDAAALLLMCTKHGLLLFHELEEVAKKAKGDAGDFAAGVSMNDIMAKAAGGQQQPSRPPAEGATGGAEGAEGTPAVTFVDEGPSVSPSVFRKLALEQRLKKASTGAAGVSGRFEPPPTKESTNAKLQDERVLLLELLVS